MIHILSFSFYIYTLKTDSSVLDSWWSIVPYYERTNATHEIGESVSCIHFFLERISKLHLVILTFSRVFTWISLDWTMWMLLYFPINCWIFIEYDMTFSFKSFWKMMESSVNEMLEGTTPQPSYHHIVTAIYLRCFDCVSRMKMYTQFWGRPSL